MNVVIAAKNIVAIAEMIHARIAALIKERKWVDLRAFCLRDQRSELG